MKLTLHGLLLATALLLSGTALAQNNRQDSTLQAFSDLKLGMFVHFGINTYTDQEWTDGTVSPSLFNPSKLDTDQWCKAAKEAGMKYVVFTAKHHEGFCNWPTQYTDYSVKSTPFKRDIIKELAASCRKYGLRLGIYYSLWDRHDPSYADTYQYTEYMKNQLHELLTGYGDILLVWFDGAWDKCSGFNEAPSAEAFMRNWRDNGAYRWQWDQIYDYIKQVSPNCLVMNNSGIGFPGIPLMPVDIRSGERGKSIAGEQDTWEFGGRPWKSPMQVEDIVSKKYWFYHAGDTTVKSVTDIRKLITEAEQQGTNLLLNVGPMEDGRLRPQDIELLRQLKQ